MRAAIVTLAAILAALALSAPSAVAATTFVVNSVDDTSDGTPTDNACDTNGLAAGGVCTLRAAIEQANAAPAASPQPTAPAPYTISLTGVNGSTITVGATDLPPVQVDDTIIEGCATPIPTPVGPCVGLRANADRSGTGLDIEGDGVIVRSLAISRFATGISTSGAGTIVRNSDFGLRRNPTALESMGQGVLVTGSGARIGGPGSAEGNSFVGNDVGVRIWGGDTAAVQGNLIGLRRDATVNGNGRGIVIAGVGFLPDQVSDPATGNIVGGPSNAAIEDGGCGGNCNLIAGSASAGIDLNGSLAGGETPAGAVTIAGNWIGLDADGDAASNVAGVLVGDGGTIVGNDASGVLIGGPDAEDGNLISGNATGIDQSNGQGILTVLRNTFGVGADGDTAVANTVTNARLAGDYGGRDALVVANAFGASPTGLILTGPQACVSGNLFTPPTGTFTQAALILEAGADDTLIGREAGCVAGFFTAGNAFGRTAAGAPAILVRGTDGFDIVGNRIGTIPYAAPLPGPGVRIVDGPGGPDAPATGGLIGGDAPNLWNAIVRMSGPAVVIDGSASGIVVASGEGIAINDFASSSSLWTDLLSIPGPGNAGDGQNGGVQPPVIGVANTAGIAGTGEPGAKIRVLQRWRADNPTDGITEPISEGYTIPPVGATTTTVAPDGTWSLVFAEKLPEGQGIAASQTVAAGTSEFAPFKVAGPAPPLPIIQLTSGPTGVVSSRDASFTFATPTPGASVECALDGAAFEPCASPKIYTKLEPGPHQFRVQARLGGQVSLPLSRTWTIDAPVTTPPANKPPSATAAQRFAALVTLPSNKRCVSRRLIRLRVKRPTGAQVVYAQIRVTGKRMRTVSGRALNAPISLRGLPKGTVRVRVRILLSDGKVVSGSKTYRTCAVKKKAAKKRAVKR